MKRIDPKIIPVKFGEMPHTVLPAKSDSDVMFFVYKVIRDLESIDHLCIFLSAG